MAVEKMKLLSVVGKEENINEFIVNYLVKSGLQPENALKIFEKGWKISYFSFDNTPKELLKECKDIMQELGVDYVPEQNIDIVLKYTMDEIKEQLEQIKNTIQKNLERIKENERLLQEIEQKVLPIEHLKSLNINLEELYHLRYMRFRYGKVSKENYQKIKQQIPNIDAIMLKVEQQDEWVWIVYLTTHNFSQKVDSYFNVMRFERIWIPNEVVGKPADFIQKARIEQETRKGKTKELQKQMEQQKEKYKILLQEIYEQLTLHLQINQVKRYMAHDQKGAFYVVGWIPATELQKVLPKLKKEKELEYVIKSHDEVASKPPTHLKNPKLFKPFETIVEMYGLPDYTEIDPTILVALTAFLMFGFMFGDVGHGVIVLLLGIFLSRKKISLGPVLSFGGISSILFGFLYGSLFGKENILPSLLIRPMENIQTMLIAGIAIGAIFIIIAMILNIANGIKNKDKSRVFFDSNGVAGMIFYITVLLLVVGFLWQGKLLISGVVLTIMLGLPLILILFKETITKWLEQKKNMIKTSFMEKFFELFETLLSLISNTISFVRLAAFAINHVGLCMAIYILSDMVGGAGNIIISIIGNGVVIILEGLIVAIQVLRLEYYEMFSRFYSGDGREYKPLKVEESNLGG